MDHFCTMPLVDRVLAHGPTKSSVVTTKVAEVGRVSKADELMARRQRWIDQHYRTREHGLDYGIDL